MAVAHVQTVKTVDNTGGGTITTGSITVTANNTIVFGWLGFGNYGSALAQPTSAKLDNTTTASASMTFEANTSSNNRMRITVYVWENVSGGSHSVTTATSGNIPSNVLAFLTEVSGTATSSSTDGSGSGGSGVGTAADSGTFTTTNSDDFYVGYTTSLAANPATFTAGAGGWAIPTNGSETNSSSNLCGAFEYIANPGATSDNATFTLKTGDWVCVGIGFKAAAGSSKPTGPFPTFRPDLP